MDKEEINQKLMEANRACVARTVPLINMLGACRQQFELYVASHLAKDTDEGKQKAAVNQGMIDQIDNTLKDFQARKPEFDVSDEQAG